MNDIGGNATENGLPEIAQTQQKRNPIVLILIGAIVIIAIIIYLLIQPAAHPTNIVDEQYQITNVSTPIKEEVKNKRIDTPVKTEPPTPTSQQAAAISQALEMERMKQLEEKQRELQARLAAPLMVVNAADNAKLSTTVNTNTPNSKSHDPNTQFMQQIAHENTESTYATIIKPLNSIIAEGNLIHAILETTINSDLPGSLRAVISEPHCSEDGSRILIPRGSRLIGQYRSRILQGQSRVFVVWTRIITPVGVSVQLGSPGIDSLGGAGFAADSIDHHFWQQFGTAALLSLISAGAANAGVLPTDRENSAAEYRTALAQSFSQSANQSLQQQGMIAPTLTINQGRPIMVFVARDLHFEHILPSASQKIRVL